METLGSDMRLLYFSSDCRCKLIECRGHEVIGKDTAMRCIYMYNTDTKQILESYDVTEKSPVERELIRIEMLLRCDFPCEVFDSFENGKPYGVNRRWLMTQTRAFDRLNVSKMTIQ